MNKSLIFELQETLKQEIYARAEDVYGKKPITDGIIDIEQYYNVTPKVLWILKEAHSDNGDYFIGDRLIIETMGKIRKRA